MNQRDTPTDNNDNDELTFEAEETEEDFTYGGSAATHQPRQGVSQPTIVVQHGTGLTTASDEEDLLTADEGDGEGTAGEPGSDIGTYESRGEEEGSSQFETDNEYEYEEDEDITEEYLAELALHDPDQAAFLRFKLAYFREHGRYPSPDIIMALDGDEVVPINGGDGGGSPNSNNNAPHPHQQQQGQQAQGPQGQHSPTQQQQQQQQQPGIVASQLAPGQEGDIVSSTASDGQVLTFSPGHQHYDQALQLHHNTQAAIQQQNMMQQQQEPPISVEDGRSTFFP